MVYQNNSGPLLDRIDIHLEVPGVPFRELSSKTAGTGSAQMRQGVESARAIQSRRFAASRTRQNAQMTSREIRRYSPMDEAGHALLKATMSELGLSARAHDKILRVSRTIADLEGSEAVSATHISEAVNYRTLDRKMWM